MDIKVSVIIPVFNVEKYIAQTLESVIYQTLTDIEIICFDNGSTDNTIKIIEEFQEKDKRIILHKSSVNLKQGLARNICVNTARGKYIFFIDGDDYMALNCLEKMYNKIEQDNSDITICAWNQFDDETGKIIEHPYSKLLQIPPEFDNKPFNWRDIKYTVFWQTSVPWDKIYKKDFLITKKVEFPGGIFFEDNVFVYDALFKAEKISILRDELMFYRVNRGFAVTNRRDETFFDYLKIFNMIGDNLKKIGLYDEMKHLYLDYKIITLYWWFKKIKLPYKKRFFEMIKADFKQIQMTKKDRAHVRNRTNFLYSRFTKMPFFVYYPFFFFLDKIFRIEKGVKTWNITLFASYEKYFEKK
ncbi:glycosyltransferase family 2 protein [bacterium]|nr:glycosyltransferase family 2 protein [bacterium]